MTWNESRRSRSIAWVRVSTLLAFAATNGCARDHDAIAEVSAVDSELAALMADGVLPSGMAEAAPAPTAPPRFCPGPVGVPDEDGGVAVPPPPFGGPVRAAAGGSAAEGGAVADAGVVEASCASTPVGFWRFDDCNSSRTDLSDSSFQGHTAFRSVDLQCTTGQEGQAVVFANSEDLVYAPDQPDFALDAGVTVAAWVMPDAVSGVRTLFRKRDDADSAIALVINNRKYQFVVKLASGRLVSVSSPALAKKWTHVAASYDGTWLRLYVNGNETGSVKAPGVIARGVGPLLMGNDGAKRRFQGVMDNAWFNTLAAPAETIMKLMCVRHDPAFTVAPSMSDPVAAGTAVTYQLTIASMNDDKCDPESFFNFTNAETQSFTIDPQFTSFTLNSGETKQVDVVVSSGTEDEAGSYTLSFQLQSQDSGGGIIFPPIGISASGAATPTAVPVMGRTGFVQATAQYVIAEPTGCHVSSQRELMIRDLSVVEDAARTTPNGPASDPATGAWTFERLMQRISPSDADAPDVTEAMLRTFLTPQTVNTFTIPERTPMDELVLKSWPRTPDGKLDLARAPVLLLAITNRVDLVDLQAGKAGEGRVLFGVMDSSGNPMQFTIIFEYQLPAKTDADVRDWHDAVHALQALPFPSESYNQALQALTDRFSARGAVPERPNGSALLDIRTNELALSLDGQWQLREFHISADTGFMEPATIVQTPDASFNGSDRLARFVNQNEAAILTETHVAPLSFEDAPFQGAFVFNNIDSWDAPGITNPEARHKFSLNTCNGCHGGETQTAFLHVNPRVPGQTSSLSGFLTGETVFDVRGQQRKLTELFRRRQLLESEVCADQP